MRASRNCLLDEDLLSCLCEWYPRFGKGQVVVGGPGSPGLLSAGFHEDGGGLRGGIKKNHFVKI